MSIFALVLDGAIVDLAPATFPVHPSLVWTGDISAVSPAPQWGWTATQTNGTWTFTAPPAPVLTLAQQAAVAIAAGVTITSTATPAINGVYACDTAAQGNLNSTYNLIQRAGGSAFPAGLAALPWPTAAGVVSFTRPSDFLNVATAIGDYVLAVTLVQITGTGTLPPPRLQFRKIHRKPVDGASPMWLIPTDDRGATAYWTTPWMMSLLT
jgi:hypothetical protein